MTILQNLEVAQRYLAASIEDLTKNPDKDAISELLNVCLNIEEKYKDLCEEYDNDDKLPAGTTYEQGGLSIEFYIEADDWEEISKALRKLKVASWDRDGTQK